MTVLDLARGAWLTLRNREKVLVRMFHPEDSERLLEFFIKGLSPDSQDLFFAHGLDPDLVEWIRMEPNSDRVFRLIALKDDRIVGYAYWRDQITRPGVPLLSIAVADSHQGIGLGTFLMNCLIDEARRRRMRGIELHVFKHNQRAISLYKKLGFEMVGQTVDRLQWVMELKFDSEPRSFSGARETV